MPQFDTSVFWGQIFWMFLSFGGLYLAVQFILFPRFHAIFNARKQTLQTPVQKAEKLVSEVQKLQDTMEQKKQAFEKRKEHALNETYQKCSFHLNEVLQKNNVALMRSFKRILNEMEHEEKDVLNKKSHFVHQAIKGDL